MITAGVPVGPRMIQWFPLVASAPVSTHYYPSVLLHSRITIVIASAYVRHSGLLADHRGVAGPMPLLTLHTVRKGRKKLCPFQKPFPDLDSEQIRGQQF